MGDIVFMPGLLAAKTDYEHSVAAPAELIGCYFGKNVVVWDYHQHMASKFGIPNPNFIDDMKQDYKENIYEKHEIDYHWLQSMGGSIGIITANKYPPNKGIIVGAPAIKPINAPQFVKNKIQIATGKHQGGTFDLTGAEEFERDKRWLSNFRFYHFVQLLRAARLARKIAPGIDVPTLILQGSKDGVVRASGAKKLEKIMPNADLKEYPDLAHNLPEERDVDQIFEDVSKFMHQHR